NVAEILARRGYRVIACDFDLEAPGLEQYFSLDDANAEMLKSIGDLMPRTIRQQEVLRKIHLDPVAFPDRKSGQHIQITIQDMQAGLRKAACHALSVSVCRGSVKAIPGVGLGEPRNRADRDRHAENLQ